ncbi:TPA: hypothetical protein ACK3Q6_005311 [Burkholderia cepacia]|uniref:hypothetical protein n=1 Tax=Burkholderia TaxID=32008 RepID=UPI00075A0143|nr:hypothetical protein [Burkholderia cepacia]HDR9763431.1 hypothetical protein [Burkholderia cepacia ATCC 25416]KVL07676.1 hypothetical protein WJ46_01940 [Burkholderia cepacia]KVZ19685.1 hypothetical protein WL14_26235 [Burkholderia cepacia]MCA8363820.1 hypothetical protein [Burkholderia cepacia]HDV6369354.1 hypothetical protein [Burkholderia cepacia]
MREMHHAECAAVSGGLSSSDLVGWLNNLFAPREPREPWVNPFPSDNSGTEAVGTLGKIAVAVGVTAIAVSLAVLRRAVR